MLNGFQIKHRLALLYTACTSLFLFIFSGFVLFFFQINMISEFDQSLKERFAYLQRHLETENNRNVHFRGSEYPNKVVIQGIEEIPIVEVWQGDDRVFSNSDLTLPQVAKTLKSLVLQDRHYRMISGWSDSNNEFYIKAAFDASRVRSKVRGLGVSLAILIPFSLSGICLMGFYFARKALEPVQVLANQAQLINADNLSTRVSTGNQHDELGQLASVLNSLLNRIESSFSSLKQFTSDASHELRTPLTAIKATCEIAQQDSAIDSDKVIEEVLVEVERMTDLTESLLMLTRGDSGVLQLELSEISTLQLVEDVVGLLSVLAEEKRQTLSIKGEDTRLNADYTLIRQAIMSLLHNAIQYSGKDEFIELKILSDQDEVSIRVEDQGPGIPLMHREKIFDRFYKVDLSRFRTAGGSGLGLSIVQWIARMHNGKITYFDNAPRGAVFELTLPINQ